MRKGKGQSDKNPINWELIAADYVEGIDPGDGQPRYFPSQRDLCRKWNVSPASVSRQLRAKDVNGKDWDERRDDFQKVYRQERQAVVVERLVSKEAAFREVTMNGADLVALHVNTQLRRSMKVTPDGTPVSALPADTLVKLSSALKNAQAIGLVSMTSDEEGKGEQGGDWTLMRRVRSGQVSLPTIAEIGEVIPQPMEGSDA